MRKAATAEETALWESLRGRRLEGVKFRRQLWVGASIADFACVEAKLIVELDGSQHVDQVDYDVERDRRLTEAGWRVLRFWNNDVGERMENVLEAIRTALLARVPSPSHRSTSGGPLPLPGGEGN